MFCWNPLGTCNQRENDGKIHTFWGVGKVILAYTWFNFTDQSSLFYNLLNMHCTSFGSWDGNAFENQTGVAMVQTSKVKLGCHYRHDFWHVTVLLGTRIFLSCVILRTLPAILKAVSDGRWQLQACTSRSSLVTLKFLDNKIASDQLLAEKGDVYWPLAPVMYMLIPHQKLKSA